VHWRTADYLPGRTFRSNSKVRREQASGALRFKTLHTHQKENGDANRPRDPIVNLIESRRTRGDGYTKVLLGRIIGIVAPIGREFSSPRSQRSKALVWMYRTIRRFSTVSRYRPSQPQIIGHRETSDIILLRINFEKPLIRPESSSLAMPISLTDVVNDLSANNEQLPTGDVIVRVQMTIGRYDFQLKL